ncbi:hypothetical protein Taro_044461, partial [Colocasia esculenta]|nr:hypothetical protein [Colocasia esculenta]
VPVLHLELRGLRLWIVRLMKKPFRCVVLSLSSLVRNRSREGRRNNPQKTTELFSFGRSKEEKLKSHHHLQREATAPT